MTHGQKESLPTTTASEGNKEHQTLGYATLLLFESFRHSQGFSPFQRKIFHYLHLIRPSWTISQEDREKINTQITLKTKAYIGDKGAHGKVRTHSSESTDRNRMLIAKDNALDSMVVTINDGLEPGEKRRSKEELIPMIAQYVIQMDLNFLIRPDGRSRSPITKEDTDASNPHMDPWLSFVIHYALNQNSTNIEEYDRMYQDVRKAILSDKINQEAKDGLEQVTIIYQAKHPGVAINMQP